MLLILVMFALTWALPLAIHQRTKNERVKGPCPLRGLGQRPKVLLCANLLSFIAVFIFAAALIFSGRVEAAEAATEAPELAQAAAFIAAGLVTGLGAIGTGIAVSSAASAAIGAISENENNFGKAMIFVAMAEGIAIYGLLVAFMILGRV